MHALNGEKKTRESVKESRSKWKLDKFYINITPCTYLGYICRNEASMAWHLPSMAPA